MRTTHRDPEKLEISKEFVGENSDRYDYRGSEGARDEERLKAWLAEQNEPKCLDMSHFLDLAMWKSPRPKRHYERNSDAFVRRVTELAFQTSDDRLRLHTLTALDGVGVPVASAILHFAFPHRYAILDVRVLRTLTSAGLWLRDEAHSFTLAGWLEYIQLMRRLAKKLAVDLRDLDKALWRFDKDRGERKQ
jgi:thermostable 8-oxoguanine DNA glycosylase